METLSRAVSEPTTIETVPDDVLHSILTGTLARPSLLRLVCRRWHDLWDAYAAQLAPAGHASTVLSQDLLGRFQSVKRLDVSALPRDVANQYADVVAALPSLSAMVMSHAVGFHSTVDRLSPAVRHAHEKLMLCMEACKEPCKQDKNFVRQPQPLLAAMVALPKLRSLTVKPTDPLQLAGIASKESCHHALPQVSPCHVNNPQIVFWP